MKKSHLHRLGLKTDTAHRASKRRKDTHERRYYVKHARKWILEGFHAIDSKRVNDVLKKESLLPIEVSDEVKYCRMV